MIEPFYDLSSDKKYGVVTSVAIDEWTGESFVNLMIKNDVKATFD